MRKITLRDGSQIDALGQGTWGMGEDSAQRDGEIAALRAGFECGLRLVDTAEMYADGRAEALLGDAMAGVRDSLYLVSKVLPHHASRTGTIRACEESLERLGTDRIDLYLLHWRGNIALEETIEAMLTLKRDGKILRWGVSNFDLEDMRELEALGAGASLVTNQVLYNLSRRGIEFDLLPASSAQGVPIMAYSPIEQGRILNAPVLNEIARARDMSAAQIALAWVLRNPSVIAIPKAARIEHVRENRQALDVTLSDEELAALDAAFTPPKRAVPLEML